MAADAGLGAGAGGVAPRLRLDLGHWIKPHTVPTDVPYAVVSPLTTAVAAPAIDAHLVRRTRTSVLVIGITGAATWVVNIASELWSSLLASTLVVVACALSELWIRLGRKPRLDVIGNAVVAVSTVSVVAAAWSETPSASMSPYYFLMVVPGAANMVGIGAARLWTIVSVLLIVGMHAAELLFLPPRAPVADVLLHALDPVVLQVCIYYLITAGRAAADGYAAELGHTNEALREASRAKTVFLANMSHEIRTPMNGVLGMTDLLIETELTSDQRDLATTIRSSGITLLSVINDVLDISKIEAGKMTVEQVPLAIESVVEEVIQLFATSALSKGVDVVGGCDPDLPARITGDPTRLRQVLSNLVANAVKFTAQGEVRVRVSRPQPDKLRFAVEDTGIGISAEAQRRLFQAFEQADGSTTRRSGGTGLGLAISKSLVELMGGRIGLESVLGGGATFWFELPCAPVLGEDQVSGPQFSGQGVVLVGLDGGGGAFIERHLRAWGLDVVRGDVGVATQGAFDVVLHDGSFGAAYGTRSIAVVPMGTAVAGPMLSKPVRRSALLARIQQVLEPMAAAPLRPSLGPGARASRPLDGALAGVSVLVVEDNAVNRKIALRFLARLGADVAVAENGAEAMDRLRTATFDAVLMDCQMPVMDGFAATRALRTLEQALGRRTPVIALTANAFASDVEQCRAADMDAHLAKPYAIGDLLRVLGECHVGADGVAAR